MLNPFIQHLASIYTIKKPGPFGISVSWYNQHKLCWGLWTNWSLCKEWILLDCSLSAHSFLKKWFYSFSFFFLFCLFVCCYFALFWCRLYDQFLISLKLAILENSRCPKTWRLKRQFLHNIKLNLKYLLTKKVFINKIVFLFHN